MRTVHPTLGSNDGLERSFQCVSLQAANQHRHWYDHGMGSKPTQHSASSYSLVRRAQNADPVAWDRLARIYGPVVYGWARGAGLEPSDASDLMQDVFHVLTSKLSQFERRNKSDSFRGWLYSVTRNKVRDHFRAKGQQAQPQGGTNALQRLNEWPALPETPPDELSVDGKSEVDGIRRRALELVSGEFESRTWQAFWRTAVEDDAPQDVASDLGISVWAVYKARSRVLAKLRAEFDELL